MEAETTGIVIGSGAVGALAGVASTWIKSKVAQRHARPLDFEDAYVTHGECKAHRCALEKRLEGFGPTLERIFKKLTEIDRKDEDRINSVHRRIDPLIERIAATGAEVEVLKGKQAS